MLQSPCCQRVVVSVPVVVVLDTDVDVVDAVLRTVVVVSRRWPRPVVASGGASVNVLGQDLFVCLFVGFVGESQQLTSCTTELRWLVVTHAGSRRQTAALVEAEGRPVSKRPLFCVSTESRVPGSLCTSWTGAVREASG